MIDGSDEEIYHRPIYVVIEMHNGYRFDVSPYVCHQENWKAM